MLDQTSCPKALYREVSMYLANRSTTQTVSICMVGANFNGRDIGNKSLIVRGRVPIEKNADKT